ncbi:serine/threonine-protein kinase [Nodularia spumigena]|uniref:Serine/threonine-protein kinase n=1 Tax=Nodularia spumigena UHCC 0060 TaxID=3110300 RepID=A0ABU5UVN0_NODSP|nr:serine/threonine-protein kinase [Nodularia spumigena]MEA5527355.1 serine/threonine-protein kinase [Nodularia spumigena UHCC 0143]MEA5610358.1 serine/threonine-protein kinase [Nodularia spumigena UHCC 0060]MEA5613316.1 serine/threonine-protein kinase [Nodularia spumigena UHCC 0040]
MICCLNPDCPNPLNLDKTKLCRTCSTPLVPLLRNRFRVIRVLSDEGGFGRTYLSEDTDKLNERCVIKQLAPKFEGTWSQKKAVELFAEEAKLLQELGEHPQIPTLLAYFEQDNCLYLVQQFVNGQNLLNELQRRKLYKPGEIHGILLHLLPVLQFIHDRGVIHRDIKPENIIRRYGDGRLSLIDFGSSKQLTARVQKKVGTSIGSHGYSPLEQIRDGKAYPASDLFGLGATCFHLLTGVSPFQLWMEYGYGWVTNWRQYLRSPLSAELDYVLDKLLRKDIQQRYQSADEVIRELIPKQPLALPPTGKSSGKIPVTQVSSLPVKYTLLKNVVLVSALILLFGIQDSWYQQYRRVHTVLLSRLSQTRSSSRKSVVDQSPNLNLKNISLSKVLQADQGLVLSVAISPDSQIFASSGERLIKVWHLGTGKEIATLKGHEQRVNVVAISPDGRTLVSGSDDQTIKIWDLFTGELIRTLRGHSNSIQAIAISPDGATLASGSDDNTIKLWNMSTGSLRSTLRGHTSWVRSLAISPDGITLVSGSFDKTIKMWDLNKAVFIDTLNSDTQTVTSIAFSPDGMTLASASRDVYGGKLRTIKLWNLATKHKSHTLAENAQTVTSIAFSPDNTTLVSGSRERTIKLWNLATGKEMGTLLGHKDTVTSVAISPDGKSLVSASEDNTIMIWRVSE